jgi:hypothetical protein
MDSKTLIKALKVAVREVIKEELTEILKEGLQSTINEMAQPKKSVKTETVRVAPRMVNEAGKKPKVQFSENKWASVLNQTDPLIETNPAGISGFKELLQEGMDELRFDSSNAQTFGMSRTANAAPSIMEDPETGKVFEVDTVVAKAMTRDYSALMKAIEKKKGN